MHETDNSKMGRSNMNAQQRIRKIRITSGKSIILLVIFMIGTLFTLASTGDGGSDGGGDRVLPPATLTADNADEVVGAGLQVADLAGPVSAFGATEDITLPAMATGDSEAPLGNLIGQMHAVARTVQTQSDFNLQAVSEDCLGGGTQEISDTESVIELPNIVFELTISYNNCVIGTKTLNGIEKIRFETDLAGQSVFKNFEFSTENFSYEDSANGDDLTYTDFSVFVDELTLDLAELEDVSLSLTGKVNGTAAGEAINIEYDNFTIAMSSVAGGDEYRLSGNFKAGCMDGWVDVSTDTPIFVPNGGDCPTAGGVTISSAGKEITVEIINDDDVSVAFDGGVPTVYGSCSDIEGLCI